MRVDTISDMTDGHRVLCITPILEHDQYHQDGSTILTTLWLVRRGD